MSQSTQPAASSRKTALDQLLADFVPGPDSAHPMAVQQAVYLARAMQSRANELQTPQERRQQAELDRMIHNPKDKATLIELTDQAFRASTPHRAIDQLVHILDVQGIPRFFSPVDRALLKGFQSFGSYLPGVAAPLVKEKMHKETANVILPAEAEMLSQHLGRRHQEGVRMNVNFLGEALLGEAEAKTRLDRYLAALKLPEMEVISVKISTIYSQIAPLARRHTIDVLCDRMERLYRAAANETFRRADGTASPKFVYLDMEEYRDMSLTAAVFMRTLDRPGMHEVRAGLALQAYIPDSYLTQRELTEWARGRVALGGAPVTLRIVKGANMEMERLDASMNGWPQAPFKTKRETDANFKRMLHWAMIPENLAAVKIGIATHNLFDLAYGLVVARTHDALDHVQFEMLEGMANHQRRALRELAENLLLYAPASRRDEFIHAIGYLIRRLDENTGPDNFLRHAFKLAVDSPDWKRLQQAFLDSFDELGRLSDAPRRRQDRHLPVDAVVDEDRPWFQLVNEPSTDFALPHNAQWAEKILTRWQDRCGHQAVEIPLVVDGESIYDTRQLRQCLDPSRPGVVVGRYRQASREDVERAVRCARADPDGWRRLGAQQRSRILGQVAHQLRCARGDLMGAALADGGKTLAESDPEVSEAVDFVEFYRKAALYYHQLPWIGAGGRGVVAVISPWNFPLAIPCGGVAAALAAGNTVILKPASDTVLTAHALCECFWLAGVSRKVLQLVPCSGSTEGQQLVAHPDVDTVILTGGTETALAMLQHRPATRLLAETGGKNATIVTALADREQAIKHVIQSAFSHSGQKCSATSLLILEEEVYHDTRFKRTFCDAVQSLPVGSAWDLATRIGPLIRRPSGVLEQGLKELQPGESWAVAPALDHENPNLVSPGVKWYVEPGSFTHMTELFGPVLAVMKARDLHQAIDLVNQTGYGLTSGLESLDDREQQVWKQRIRAGNLYINRPTTGAIVLRQPFGGMGKSAFGPGIKAGGPNYVAQFMDFQEPERPPSGGDIRDPHLGQLMAGLEEARSNTDGQVGKGDLDRLRAAFASYDHWMREEFGRQHDHFRLIGQDNIRRYLPVRQLRVRLHDDDSLFDIFARVGAAKSAGCHVTVSYPHATATPAVQLLDQLTEPWAGAIEFVVETDGQLAAAARYHQTDRLRYADPQRVPELIRRLSAQTGLFVADAPVRMHGRIELVWYVEEQSLSINYHRYGNLGARADEPREEPL